LLAPYQILLMFSCYLFLFKLSLNCAYHQTLAFILLLEFGQRRSFFWPKAIAPAKRNANIVFMLLQNVIASCALVHFVLLQRQGGQVLLLRGIS
jgi:hypothetical protein